MKKIILSAASLAVAAVASVSVAPTTSEAIPAFARQTGAACLSCHFQSFPTLSAFGRSFKMNALTGMGDQALIEGESLSIPSVLNASVVFRPQLISEDVSGSAASIAAANTTAGTTETIAATADQVVLIGGRVGANTGAFVEIGFGAGGGFANSQLFNAYDMGDLKVGWSYFNTGFGEDAGMQLMSVWGQHGGLMGGKSLSINNSMGAAQNTAGFSANVGNNTWMASLGLVDPNGDDTDPNDNVVGAFAQSFSLAPVLRGVYFMDAGSFELGFGVINVSGSTGGTNGITEINAERTGFDFQAQGEVGSTQVGVYADYATAASGSGTIRNSYNPSFTDDRTGYSLRATVKPTHNIILMAGVGQDETGTATTDKVLFGAEYEVSQNFVIALTQGSSELSGITTDTTTLDIEVLM